MQKWKVVCIWFILGILLSLNALRTQKPCKLKKQTHGYVCVIDDEYCDELDIPDPIGDEYVLVTSSENKHRFIYDVGVFKNDSTHSKNCGNVISIDQSKMSQTIRGFGGAWTTTVEQLVSKLSTKMRKCFYKSYFSQNIGAAYKFLRVPIGGCDFDTGPWAYNSYPENDTTLSNFTRLDRRDIRRNAQIKDMMCLTKNKDVEILGTAWGPPKS